MRALVIAEHDGTRLKAGAAQAVSAAARMAAEVHVLVAGSNARAAAEASARLSGVAKVLLAEAAHYEDASAENFAALVAPLATAYTHVVAAASAFGKGVMPRIAALLDVSQVSDIVAVEASDTFVRPIYAGNALATVVSEDRVKVVTVRTTAFDRPGEGPAAPVEPLDAGPDVAKARVVSRELNTSERPELGAARRVVSGGRGLANGENFRMLEALADKLGAAIGASRAAVDSGYCPNDYQVGQTGKIVAPELYMAIGISGAIQHLAGMKESKVIVAINKDPDAPIFQVADYGLVADLFEAVPALTEKL